MAEKFNLENYVTVQERINRFWAEYPDGAIRTVLASDPADWKICRYRAEVYKHRDSVAPDCVGYAVGIQGVGMTGKTTWEETAETSAIGRALANLSYAIKDTDRPSREEMQKVSGPDFEDDERQPATSAKPPIQTRPPAQRSGSEPPVERPQRTMDADAITDSQIAAIRRLVAALGIIEADLLKHCGVTEWTDLNSRKASTVIGQLERRAAKAPAPQPPAANGTATARISDAQRDELQGLLEKAGLDVREWVTERGLTSLAEMVPEQFYREVVPLRKLTLDQAVAAR